MVRQTARQKYSLSFFKSRQFIHSKGPFLLSHLVTGVRGLHDASDRVVATLLGPEDLIHVGSLVLDQGQAFSLKAVLAKPLGSVYLFLQEGQPKEKTRIVNNSLMIVVRFISLGPGDSWVIPKALG